MSVSSMAIALLFACVGTQAPAQTAAVSGMTHTVELTTTGPGPVSEDVSALGITDCEVVATRLTRLADSSRGSMTEGFPVPSCIVDGDGDGIADELLFISEYTGTYRLLLTRSGDRRPREDWGIEVESASAPSWSPEFGHAQDAADVSRAAKMLSDTGPMLVCRLRECSVLFGVHSGLIEAMHLRGQLWAGSVCGEWSRELPNRPDSGLLAVVDQTPLRVRLRHRGAVTRDIEVWWDGTVLAAAAPGSPQTTLAVAGHPFDCSRIDDVEAGIGDRIGSPLEADLARVQFRGADDWQLAVSVSGAKALGQSVALDSGIAALERSRAGEETAWEDAYIPGAAWLHPLQPQTDSDFRMHYRVSRQPDVLPSYVSPQRAAFGQVEDLPADAALSDQEEPAPRQIVVRSVSAEVPRLVAGSGYGWKLRPFTLSEAGAVPGYFEVTVTNPYQEQAPVVVKVEGAPWIAGVQLLTNWQRRADATGVSHESYGHREKIRPVEGAYSVSLDLPGRAQGRFLIAVAPGPSATGGCRTGLRVIFRGEAVRVPVDMDVRPSFPHVAPSGRPGLTALRGMGFNTIRRKAELMPQDQSASDAAAADPPHVGSQPAIRAAREQASQMAGMFEIEEFAVAPLDTEGTPLADGRLSEAVLGYLSDRGSTDFPSIAHWASAAFSGPRTHEAFTTASQPFARLFTANEVNSGAGARVACDVAILHAAASREGGREALSRLTTDRQALFSAWLADPTYSAVVAVGKAAHMQVGVVIGTAPTHDAYLEMRRFAWWCALNGAGEGGIGWGDLTPLPGSPHWALVPVGDGKWLLTDRALAIMHAHEDLQLIAQVRDARSAIAAINSATAREALRMCEELEAIALRLSQEGHFGDARGYLNQALAALTGAAS